MNETEFYARLRSEVDRIGWSFRRLGAAIEVNATTLCRWYRRQAAPIRIARVAVVEALREIETPKRRQLELTEAGPRTGAKDEKRGDGAID